MPETQETAAENEPRDRALAADRATELPKHADPREPPLF